MDGRVLRTVFGEFATGVTIITCTREDGTPHGATVTAFMPLSLEPPLLQVALTRSSKACTYLRGAAFTVNILASDQLDLAMHFAGCPMDRDPEWDEGPAGPILCGSAASIPCEPWADHDGGDHIVFTGRILDAAVRDVDPLLFYRSSFHGIGDDRAATKWTGFQDDSLSGWFDADTRFTAITPQSVAATPGI
ncbi:putative oxidoreductase [Flexivirga endophytica]|uniref:Oxidoreductase n=1 Tax=Flexivirga endophytica TaxID=1849103 RepID=A0A916T774_9MICO|nr:flavin reductase family protein [Flexivirga endophytica]GGB34544.1 putative oxidoreductase [Flexivirga endophytica]GHB42476.1 putative oxidoreductase [Flexivirga endophytica]